MSVTTSKLVVLIIELVWALPIGRSIITMIGGKNVFRKAYKNENSSFIPILNLFSMLEIGDVSTFWGILFFVPFLNLIPLMLMGVGIGKNFNCSTGFTIGLVVLPFIFYPMLAFSDKSYKVNDEEYFKALNSVRGNDMDLMIQDEPLNQMETLSQEENKIDSIFKSDLALMEEAPAYKAQKLDNSVLDNIDSLTNNYDEFAPIKKVEPGFQAYGEADTQDHTPIKVDNKKEDELETIDL